MAHLLTTTYATLTTRRHLNLSRRHRTYPRVVKRIRHNGYRVKQPHDTGTHHPGPPTINLITTHHQRPSPTRPRQPQTNTTQTKINLS